MDSEEGKEEGIVLSCDVFGNLASWDAATGLCLTTKRQALLSGQTAITDVLYSANHSEVMLAMSIPQQGEEVIAGVSIVGIDIATLEINRILKNAVQRSFIASNASDQPQRLLDTVAFGDDSVPLLLLSISSTGVFLIWMNDESQKTAEILADKMFPDAFSMDMTLPLTSASFDKDRHLLLLTDASSWYILQYELLEDEELCFPCQFRTLAFDYPIRFNRDEMKDDVAALEAASSFALTGNSSYPELPYNEELDETLHGPIVQGALLDSHSKDKTFQKSDSSADKVLLALWTKGGTMQLISIQSNGQCQLQHVRQAKEDCSRVILVSDGASAVEIHEIKDAVESSVSVSRLLTTESGHVFVSTATGLVSDSWSSSTQKAKRHKQSRHDLVTCLHLITSISSIPYILAQGMSNGDIVYHLLAAYAIPHDLEADTSHPSALTVSKGHTAAVLICKEVIFKQPSASPSLYPAVEDKDGMYAMPILLTGTADGAVGFWSLVAEYLGQQLFIVRPHTDRVQQFLCPSRPMVLPWQTCVMSVGDDGIVALISLEELKVVRLCSGNPSRTRLRLHWDAKRGFLSCLANGMSESSLLSIWDLHQSHRDRVFNGPQAMEMEQIFIEGLEEFRKRQSSMTARDNTQLLDADAHVTEWQPPSDSLSLSHKRASGIALLQLYKSSEAWLTAANETKQDLERVNSGDLTPWIIRMATGLSALHLWGIDSKTDCAMQQMVKTISEAELFPSSTTSHLTQLTQAFSLTQGVALGHSDARTIDFPRSSKTEQDGAVIGSLWKTQPEFVAEHRIFMVATSKQLMHEVFSETICSACSNLATMYAIQLPYYVPDSCHPSLNVIVYLWDSSIPVLREASRVLLASIADLAAIQQELQQGTCSLTVGCREVRATLEMAEIATPSGLNSEAVSRDDILVCAAICCVHCRLVTQELLSAVLKMTSMLSTETQQLPRTSALAALIMAEAFAGIEGRSWLMALTDPVLYMNSVLNACDQLELLSRRENETLLEEVSDTKSPTRTVSKVKSMADLRPGTPLSASQRTTPLNVVDEQRSEYLQLRPSAIQLLFIDLLKQGHKQQNRSSDDVRSLFGRSITLQANRDSWDAREQHQGKSPRQDHVSDRLEDNKAALVKLVTAVVHLDLSLVLECLQERFPSSCPFPFSQVAVVKALETELHRREGLQNIVQNLPLVLSTILRALNPADQPSKQMTSAEVTALTAKMNEQYPMMDIHHDSASLAVGCPLLAMNTSDNDSTGDRSQQEAIAIYNLNTGIKKRSLSMGRVFYEMASHSTSPSQANDRFGIGALCFRKDGELLVALCPEVRALCVWNLHISWQQKLASRSNKPLEPIKIHQAEHTAVHVTSAQLCRCIQIRSSPGPSTADGVVDLSFKVFWQLSSQVAVMQGFEQLDSLELHVGH